MTLSPYHITRRLGQYIHAHGSPRANRGPARRGSRVDNWAHLGGALGGAAAAFLFGPNLVRVPARPPVLHIIHAHTRTHARARAHTHTHLLFGPNFVRVPARPQSYT